MNPDCRKPVLLWGGLGGFTIGIVDFLRTSNLRRGVQVGLVSILFISTCANIICHHLKFKRNQEGRMSYFDFKKRLDEELAQKLSLSQKRM
uniref:Cytochrome c oxidase assembly protein COX20, mitochondrial n=1 Tax=Schistosoma mansoni TaxID=6183 RepID=A0A5K4F4L9_SCHMA